MSKSEILYMKGMDMSEFSDGEEDVEEDIWDDSKLNSAYDKALRMANVEVAKRIAMSTNSKNGNEGRNNLSESKAQKPKSGKQSQSAKKESKKDKINWKPGMPCRALYEDDGLEYEAFILRVINDKEAIVRFLGYENSEIVPIHTIKPTLGKKERSRQVEDAIRDKHDDGFETIHQGGRTMTDCMSDGTSTGSIEKPKKNSKKKKQPKQQATPGFTMPQMPFAMPQMPFTMPNLDMFKNLDDMEMPLPPPPPLQSTPPLVSEHQAISSMLLSWYMSGYYTGLYQGMRRSKDGAKN